MPAQTICLEVPRRGVIGLPQTSHVIGGRDGGLGLLTLTPTRTPARTAAEWIDERISFGAGPSWNMNFNP
jgi:hypothetical protein